MPESIDIDSDSSITISYWVILVRRVPGDTSPFPHILIPKTTAIFGSYGHTPIYIFYLRSLESLFKPLEKPIITNR